VIELKICEVARGVNKIKTLKDRPLTSFLDNYLIDRRTFETRFITVDHEREATNFGIYTYMVKTKFFLQKKIVFHLKLENNALTCAENLNYPNKQIRIIFDQLFDVFSKQRTRKLQFIVQDNNTHFMSIVIIVSCKHVCYYTNP